MRASSSSRGVLMARLAGLRRYVMAMASVPAKIAEDLRSGLQKARSLSGEYVPILPYPLLFPSLQAAIVSSERRYAGKAFG